jgi:hypothetical protein
VVSLECSAKHGTEDTSHTTQDIEYISMETSSMYAGGDTINVFQERKKV